MCLLENVITELALVFYILNGCVVLLWFNELLPDFMFLTIDILLVKEIQLEVIDLKCLELRKAEDKRALKVLRNLFK